MHLCLHDYDTGDDALKLMDLASGRPNWMILLTRLSRIPTGFSLEGAMQGAEGRADDD